MKTIFPLIISNTDLNLLSQCELKWFRERCQCLRKQSFNIDLTAGGSFAKGLELTRKAFYQDKKDSETSIEIGYNYILEEMHEKMKFENTDVLKSPERMALALKEYFKKWPLEDVEVIPAEREDGSFAIEHTITKELPVLHPELGVPLIFKGKLDMLATEMGRTWIVDEKTTKQISSNTGEMLRPAGQFAGYKWLAKQEGLEVQGVKIRKVAIQVREIKLEEFQIPITDFMVERWYSSLLNKLTNIANKYKSYISGEDFVSYFLPDYQQGCTSFNKSCPFVDGCVSANGEKFIKSEFEQIVWDAVNSREVSIDEYRELMGLK